MEHQAQKQLLEFQWEDSPASIITMPTTNRLGKQARLNRCLTGKLWGLRTTLTTLNALCDNAGLANCTHSPGEICSVLVVAVGSCGDISDKFPQNNNFDKFQVKIHSSQILLEGQKNWCDIQIYLSASVCDFQSCILAVLSASKRQ